MTTAKGRAHVVSRLTSCLDLASLRRVWERLGHDYQHDPEIEALKDKLKKELS